MPTTINDRVFQAVDGDPSTGNAGPTGLKADTDNLRNAVIRHRDNNDDHPETARTTTAYTHSQVTHQTLITNGIHAITVTGNWNDYKDTGFYMGTNLTNSCPGTHSWKHCIIMRNASNHVVQIMFDFYGKHNYIRSLLSGVWSIWRPLAIAEQEVLWSGAYYMTDTQTVTPSKKLSDCANGWLLIWSDYDMSTSTINDYGFAVSVVPKSFPEIFSGGGVFYPIIDTMNATNIVFTGKYLYIYDGYITGNSLNNVDAIKANEVILRRIVSF